jgi:hypothetical protein
MVCGIESNLMKSGDIERMKIKTITCHNVYNVGASLQAYALFRYLQDLGHDVKIIDYEPPYLRHYKLWGVDNPAYDRPILREVYGILKLPRRIRARQSLKKRLFDKFTREYLSLTERSYTSDAELKKNPPQADLYIAGSDQIWNPYFKNGLDPAFYLDFVPDPVVRASYAASFAVDHIAEEKEKKISSMLKRFDFISVRESTGLELLKHMGIENAQQVLDPVFLPDPSVWLGLSENRMIDQPYVLIYDFDQNPELMRRAETIARKKSCITVSMSGHAEADRKAEAGPLEFLSLIRYADAVVTNSFHATAFSVLFERPFLVYDRKEPINTRMHDFLRLLGLGHDNLAADYEGVRRILSERADESRAYLLHVISSTTKQGKRM